MTEKLLRLPFSLLILKPEALLLPENDLTRVKTRLRKELGPNIIETHTATLTRHQVESIWDNVASYPWSGNYYDFMNGKKVAIYALEGETKAEVVKKGLRMTFTSEINYLTQKIGLGYVADIFHGSDPGRQVDEAKILGII